MNRFRVFVFLAAAIAVSAASLSAATVDVSMANGNQFSPATVTVLAGDTVRWVNNDSRPHTSTSGPNETPDGLFDSGNVSPGASFSYTFASAGTFPYFCAYHSGMTGTVVVVSADAVVNMPNGLVFDPQTLTVNVGDTVAWINTDRMPHTTTSGNGGTPDGEWDSGNMSPGAVFTHTFTAAGQFAYYCAYHLPGMVGGVEVVGAAAPLVVHVTKSGTDAVIHFPVQSKPVSIWRGTLRNLGDLAVIDTVASGDTFVDPTAVAGPPNQYFYQASVP